VDGLEGGFNGIAIQIGLAEKSYWDFASDVPLMLTLNGKTDILFSGGSRAAAESMSAGATGLIFGRNVWQRDHDESLRFVDRLHEILAKYPTP